jgi:uncharacterized protein YqeY
MGSFFRREIKMKERILVDLKNAMKNQNKDLLNVVRMVKGAIQLEEIKVKHVLNDDEVITIIAREIKTRKESIKEFEKGGRTDLVEKTEKEIELLNKYMPEQLSEEEIIKTVNDVFDELKPSSVSDMGKIMGKLTPILKGKADLGLVNKIVREKLNK